MGDIKGCTVGWKISKSYWRQESPAVARKNALYPMQFLLQYWHSKLSKVD